MVFAKAATIEVRDVDRYGRLVGRVYIDGKDVSLALVRAGLAGHYKRYSGDPVLANAEAEARSRKVGLGGHANSIPSWEYRHLKRRESTSRQAASTDLTVRITTAS